MLQPVFGRLTFCARFLEHGRAKLNSAYASLARARGLHCRDQKAMISKEMSRDVDLSGEIRGRRWAPLVTAPTFAFPGSQGLSSNPSLTRGWGVHAFGALVNGT